MSTHKDIDTHEFLAVRHPEMTVETFREVCGVLKGLQQDKHNTGHNVQVILQFMKGWKVKFTDVHWRRTGTCNE